VVVRAGAAVVVAGARVAAAWARWLAGVEEAPARSGTEGACGGAGGVRTVGVSRAPTVTGGVLTAGVVTDGTVTGGVLAIGVLIDATRICGVLTDGTVIDGTVSPPARSSGVVVCACAVPSAGTSTPATSVATSAQQRGEGRNAKTVVRHLSAFPGRSLSVRSGIGSVRAKSMIEISM
jgi:hypothetical protein